MKFLIFFSMLMITTLSFGGDTDDQSEVHASGKTQARVWYKYFRTEGTTRVYDKDKLQLITTELNYTEWGEGKIRGALTFKGTRKCPIVRVMPFIGIDNGFGEFDLYSKSDDLINNGQKIASMVKLNGEVLIGLPAGKNVIFVERILCEIVIPGDASLMLEIR